MVSSLERHYGGYGLFHWKKIVVQNIIGHSASLKRSTQCVTVMVTFSKLRTVAIWVSLANLSRIVH